MQLIVTRNNYFQSALGNFVQTTGIAMGTNCAPDLANFVGLGYEVYNRYRTTPFGFAIRNRMLFFKRFIDDIIVFSKDKDLHIPSLFKDIYASHHQLTWTVSNFGPIPYLDLALSIQPFITARYSRFARSTQYVDWN